MKINTEGDQNSRIPPPPLPRHHQQAEARLRVKTLHLPKHTTLILGQLKQGCGHHSMRAAFFAVMNDSLG